MGIAGNLQSPSTVENRGRRCRRRHLLRWNVQRTGLNRLVRLYPIEAKQSYVVLNQADSDSGGRNSGELLRTVGRYPFIDAPGSRWKIDRHVRGVECEQGESRSEERRGGEEREAGGE